MGKVSVVWTTLTDNGERAWILDQEIESGAEPEEGAWILEKQLSQKKYTRHLGLVDWLLSLTQEKNPISPPFDIYISTSVNKNDVTSVQRIEVATQNRGRSAFEPPPQSRNALPPVTPIANTTSSKGCRLLGIGIFVFIFVSVLMLSAL
ncbi:MAG: hypothetical protein OXI77_02305 [Chloroflexota bacterium]|nr:hypothetical protein [Chloroflexota bacterium]MDE2910594.1 hypothetical protein [Chloroflexota bacterium]